MRKPRKQGHELIVVLVARNRMAQPLAVAPLVFASAVLSVAALAAVLIPARRASTIDPMAALKSE